jgi:hypothetical protein
MSPMSLQPNRMIATAEATRIWQLYGFEAVKDLVLGDLALAMGVVVLEGPLDSAVARLIRKGKRGLIRVRSGIPEYGRKRFAVAHELGHWVLHEKLSQLWACTEDDMLAAYKGSPPEVEANSFAAELLMPERLFGQTIEGTRPKAPLISNLASDFQCSLTATAIRYVELSDDYCALVVSENGRVRWWRASTAMRPHFRLDANSLLPPLSIAATIHRGRVAPVAPQPLDIGVWVQEDDDADGETEFHEKTILEHAIHIERYGQIISLLWLP